MTLRNCLHQRRGFALIETLIAIPLLITIVSASLTAGYLGFAKVWLRYSSYEAVICLASISTESLCETRWRNQIAILSGHVERLSLNKTSQEARVKLAIRLIGAWQIQEVRSLRLPLRPSRGAL